MLSAFYKLIDIRLFEQQLSNYGSVYFSYLAPAIIILEFYLGSHLFFLLKRRKMALYSGIMLFFFTIFYSYFLFSKGIESCGCFGSLWQDFFDKPFVFYIKNTFLFILSLAIYNNTKDIETEDDKLKRNIIYLLLAVVIYQSGFSFMPMRSQSQEIEKHKLFNSSVIDLGLDEYYEFEADSSYIVFLFSYSCPHCVNSIANISLYKNQTNISEIIYVPFGTEESRREFDKYFNLNGVRFEDNIPQLSSLVKAFPTTVFIENNIVTFVEEGLMPSPLLFYGNKNIK